MALQQSVSVCNNALLLSATMNIVTNVVCKIRREASRQCVVKIGVRLLTLIVISVWKRTEI